MVVSVVQHRPHNNNNMKLFITLSIALFGVIEVLSQEGGRGGGRRAGGLLHGELEEGHRRGTIIGLSRGIEVGRHHGGGGGSGGGGRGEEHRERGEEHRHRERGEGGFGGSHFNTPVEVHHEEGIHLKAHPEFRYEYHVADHKTKDFKSKHEEREGYKVKGSYSYLQPDHRIRVVDYTSDKKRGWIARVSYRKHD